MVLKNNWVGSDIHPVKPDLHIHALRSKMVIDTEPSGAARSSSMGSPEPPSGSSGEQDDSIKSLALTFWRAFVGEDSMSCEQALNRLSEASTTNETLLREIAATTVRGRRESEGGGDIGGKSPRSASQLSSAQQKVIDCWIDKGMTSLVLLDSSNF